MLRISNWRGGTCHYCGHRMRLFSDHCGRCFQRKTPLQRVPRVAVPAMLLLASAAALGIAAVAPSLHYN